MTLHIRNATATDLERLVSFALSEAKETEGLTKEPESIREGIRTAHINDSVALYWVIENDTSKVIGSAYVVKELSDWNAAYYWWVQSMYNLPEFLGKGIMDKLIRVVKNVARQERTLDLRLYVHSTNERAIRAYGTVAFPIQIIGS